MKQHGDYRFVSTGVVNLLVKQGMTLTRIANMLGVTKSYISRVKAGQRSLTLDHIGVLGEQTDQPLAFLLLKSMDPKSIPSHLMPLYRSAWKMMAPPEERQKVRAPSRTPKSSLTSRARSRKAA
jgi:transcriptional regulator with XRE-family HTH domain